MPIMGAVLVVNKFANAAEAPNHQTGISQGRQRLLTAF
jgi:hypothetical protein